MKKKTFDPMNCKDLIKKKLKDSIATTTYDVVMTVTTVT